MDRLVRKAPARQRTIQTLLMAIKPLADSGGPIPLPYMLTFLMVALDEGKSVGAYARELNVDRFLMSRHIRCIGDRGRNGRPGLGLVTTRRVDNYPARTAIFLTDKGRAVAAQVHRNLQPAQ
jgi:DNA-binding MarR family transcriptional regulator